ncbi:DUF4932 domain-containing protein [Brevundimonas balnearis]|uniref:DUF4932 domain-containing protein n=1 Tax=Brevundimonas balnearis TaxID=1572858 RepID=A0ABV6QZW0_9CAUL
MSPSLVSRLVVLVGLTALPAFAQSPDMALEAQRPRVQIEIGGEGVGGWEVDPVNYPRQLNLPVSGDAPTAICFVQDDRRACADFTPGQSRTLEITYGEAVIRSVITAVSDGPAAVFDDAYQAAHRGRTVIEVPEVYELVNIAISLAPAAADDEDLIYQASDYRRAVREHFSAHADHPLIARIDAALRENPENYFLIKMNGYAFVFDEAGAIVQSPVYDRTGFEGSYQNPVRSLLADLNDFARVSGFRDFYAAHRDVYARQIAFFETEAGVARINTWLMERFPSVPPYDGIKIIFSPLVAYNQSLTTIEADGYRELQPHVNYPYDVPRGTSPEAGAVQRSAILFTEMNHGYINPTAEPYRERIAAALADRSVWADDSLAAGSYVGPQQLFNEYMNWGLVSLYFADLMDEADFARAHPLIVANQRDGRGMRRFAEFDAELLRLYRARPEGGTIEALYPDIIAWFEAEGARAEAARLRPSDEGS